MSSRRVPSAIRRPFVDDADPVAEPFGLLHVVRGVDHPDALGSEPGHAGQDGVAALRVDADGRFVEDQQLRAVEQADPDVEAAFHSAGELIGPFTGPVGETDRLEDLLDAAGRGPSPPVRRAVPKNLRFSAAVRSG